MNSDSRSNPLGRIRRISQNKLHGGRARRSETVPVVNASSGAVHHAPDRTKAVVQLIYRHVSHFQQLCKGVSTHVEEWVKRTGPLTRSNNSSSFQLAVV